MLFRSTDSGDIIFLMHKSLFYPEHIYDPYRIALARMIVEKESRKLFLEVPEESWTAIDTSIKGWSEQPTEYHLEDDGPRDFWDTFAALMESVKLKPSFTTWITAENVHWHEGSISIRDIEMTSPLGQLKQLSDLDVHSGLPFAEVMEALDKSSEARSRQKELIDRHSTDSKQDEYPIIVRKTGADKYKVMDGNRRTLKAVIYRGSRIKAWIGESEGGEPKNYWIPLNDMFQLVKIYKEAVEQNDEQLRLATARVLQARFRASKVAVMAYQARIGNQTDIAKQLFDLTQQLQ